jgi:hypothetical protein
VMRFSSAGLRRELAQAVHQRPRNSGAAGPIERFRRFLRACVGRVRPATRGERRSSPWIPCSPWLVISPRRYRRRKSVSQVVVGPSRWLSALLSIAKHRGMRPATSIVPVVWIRARSPYRRARCFLSELNDTFDPALLDRDVSSHPPQLLLLRTAAVACDVFLARALERDGVGRFRFARLPRGTPQHRSVYRATTLAHECVLRTRLGFIERSSPSRLIVPIATLPLALCTCFCVYARGRRRGWRAARGRRGGGAGAARGRRRGGAGAARGRRGGCAWAALGRRGASRA